jgi:glycosyltransferase involved in cell wall biosynthesis
MDIQDVMSSLDVLVSASSYGEAFPNVIAEALSCEVPCVATDVGDSAYVLGPGGLVVPPNDSTALTTAIGTLLGLPVDHRRSLGRAGREHVSRMFEIRSTATRYDQLLAEAGRFSG